MDQIQSQGSTPLTDNPQAIGLPSLEPSQSGLQGASGGNLLRDDSLSQKVQLKVEVSCTQNCSPSTPTPLTVKYSDTGWWLIVVIIVVTILAVAAQFVNFKELINGQKKSKK